MVGPHDVFKLALGVGIGVGIGVLLSAGKTLPPLRDQLRPLAKTAAKSAMVLSERGRELMAELGEVLEDAAAEAHAELETERHEAPGPTGPAPVPGEADSSSTRMGLVDGG